MNDSDDVPSDQLATSGVFDAPNHAKRVQHDRVQALAAAFRGYLKSHQVQPTPIEELCTSLLAALLAHEASTRDPWQEDDVQAAISASDAMRAAYQLSAIRASDPVIISSGQLRALLKFIPPF